MSNKYLIINADDFGFSHGINLAVVKGFKAGTITSTTLMVNMPFAEEAGELTKEHDLSVGIHLNLTAGTNFFTENTGLFGKEGKVNRLRKATGALTEDDMVRIIAEYEKQLEEFNTLVGKMPTHVDHHHNLQRIPGYNEVYAEFLKKHSFPARILASKFDDFVNIPHPDRLVKNFFIDEDLTLENFTNILGSITPGVTEIITHPSVKTGETLDSYTDIPRSKQLEILLDPVILEKVAENNIELVSFKIFDKLRDVS